MEEVNDSVYQCNYKFKNHYNEKVLNNNTITIHSSNPMSSLNPHTDNTSNIINYSINFLTRTGFTNIYNNEFIKNNVFGTSEVIENKPNSFKIKYTVKPGLVWSDGTPITAVDLLFNHIISSSEYSDSAKLTDISANQEIYKFNSRLYYSNYNDNIIGMPKLSKDQMSVVFTYRNVIYDLEYHINIPFPVHSYVHLVNNLTQLQNVTNNIKAKQTFLDWFINKNTEKLSKMGDIWSISFNITTINANTNPLLLISNGGYIVEEAIPNSYVLLKRNLKYNSGPKIKDNNIQYIKIVFTASDLDTIKTNLLNNNIDIVNIPFSNSLSSNLFYLNQIKDISNVNILNFNQYVRELVLLRVGNNQVNDNTIYNGPFANSNNYYLNQKAKDLRTAFLLALPREDIVNNIIKPFNSDTTVLNSFVLNNENKDYNTIIKNSGVLKYTNGTQEERNQRALELIRKYYPNAGPTNSAFSVNLLWGTPTNQRRIQESSLIKTAMKNIGINIIDNSGVVAWSTLVYNPSYDAILLGYGINYKNYVRADNFISTYNFIGYNNNGVDLFSKKLETEFNQNNITNLFIDTEKLIMDDAVGLPLYQWPNIYVVNKRISGIKISYSSNYLINSSDIMYNYWNWQITQ